jgi:hypothetical protein
MDHKNAGADLALALSVVLTLPEMVDRYGELKRREQGRKPEDDERDMLKKEIEERYAALPAAKATVAEGEMYTLQISARQVKRTITDPMKLFLLLRKQLGLDALVALSKILLETVDKFIPESKHGLFLVSERSGPRTFTAVAKASPAAPAKVAA